MPLGTDVGLSPGDFVTHSPSPKRGRIPQFSAHGYCGQTAGRIKMALGMEVGPGPVHIVLDGDIVPLPQKGGRAPPIFGPSLLWPNGWMHQGATWYGGRLSLGDCVRWGRSLLSQKERSPTQFSAHVYCGQTAAWIKMPLSTAVDLGLRDIMFDVDPATPRKKAQPPPPNFWLWPMSIVAKWLDG